MDLGQVVVGAIQRDDNDIVFAPLRPTSARKTSRAEMLGL